MITAKCNPFFTPQGLRLDGINRFHHCTVPSAIAGVTASPMEESSGGFIHAVDVFPYSADLTLLSEPTVLSQCSGYDSAAMFAEETVAIVTKSGLACHG